MGGKYLFTCVMLERYFVFTCCSANASLSPSTRRKKKLILALGLVLMPTSRHSEKELFCVCLETECVKETELVAYCISSHFHATNDDRTLFWGIAHALSFQVFALCLPLYCCSVFYASVYWKTQTIFFRSNIARKEESLFVLVPKRNDKMSRLTKFAWETQFSFV